jgi:hypothetical protein
VGIHTYTKVTYKLSLELHLHHIQTHIYKHTHIPAHSPDINEELEQVNEPPLTSLENILLEMEKRDLHIRR